MDYHYEALDDQRFQKLCQTVIVAQYPSTQCFPVNQPDGGRDAVSFHSEPNQDSVIVFQVKFSKNPDSKTERDAIESLINSEQKKVEPLILQGATQYVLVTNVRGTAHFNSGSIDKTNKENEALTAALGISAQVWWRDDLDRRLEMSTDIKWSYPEILKATDLLPFLIKKPDDAEDLQAALTLQNYMATQYKSDRDVKFKQVDLQHKLTTLFVDVPLGHKRTRAEQNRQARFIIDESDEIEAYVSQLNFDEDHELDTENPFGHSGLAAAFLLQVPLRAGVTRLVLEGAPGQGKSTVTQFLCQVNRLRLLKKAFELEAVEDVHKTSMVRAPFRVDLRDYAAWLSGREPYSNSDGLTLSPPTSKSLESFLAMQVASQSGGLEITVDELFQFFKTSHCVIVLDGFDEVADTELRRHIVQEICEAAERLNVHMEAHGTSMQILVTSRPAAFANSPGFPEDDWIHLELKDLYRDNIEAYKDKWIAARRLSKSEGAQISSTLIDKLQQPHLRELARNPMQLAILLHLIHVQGPALPEKRTTLYEEYMKLFFNREAEKSEVVRDHRELLLSIHGMLAWLLHTQAEDGAGSGSITRSELHKEVKSYLELKEHEPALAEELLKGSVERVGALVSRVEGMFEFEVQPLREYFAARHLYLTAPYSPTGRAQKGTRPERFDAISRSFYWTNVTRFFCGFYDAGELASLVEGIISLGEQDGYKLINQPRRLAIMLLSDRVFSQEPRTMKRLIEFVGEEPGFQRLISVATMQLRRDLHLPAKEGGNVLFEVCAQKLEEVDNPSRRRALRQVMGVNSNFESLKSIWSSRFGTGVRKGYSLPEAIDFGIQYQFSPTEVATLAKDDMDLHLRWLNHNHQYEVIEDNPTLREAAIESFFAGGLEFQYRWYLSAGSVVGVEALTELLRPQVLADLFADEDSGRAAYTVFGSRYAPRKREFLERVKHEYEDGAGDSILSFAIFLLDLMNKSIREWQESLAPWAALVDRGLEEADASYVMARIAMIGTASRARDTEGVWDENGFAMKRGLVGRLFFARHKGGDVDWWRVTLTCISEDTASQCLTVLLSWGTPDVIGSLLAEIESAIEGLSSRNWGRVRSMSGYILRATRGHRLPLSEGWFEGVGHLSPRAALILIGRAEDGEAARRLSRVYFNDCPTDDAHILRRAAHNELMASEEGSIDWNYVQDLSMRAHETGVQQLFPASRSLPSKVPESVAKTVLSQCEHHSEQLVMLCEQAYATRVAQAASKVSQVAETDGWFTTHD